MNIFDIKHWKGDPAIQNRERSTLEEMLISYVHTLENRIRQLEANQPSKYAVDLLEEYRQKTKRRMPEYRYDSNTNDY